MTGQITYVVWPFLCILYMANFLSQLERDWFLKVVNDSSITPTTPLNDLKRKFFVDQIGGTSAGVRNLDDLERQWLRKVILDAGSTPPSDIYSSALWKVAVGAIGETTSRFINENKIKFYGSKFTQLAYKIQGMANLVAYLPFNESSGTTAYDYGPSGLNGTNSGATVGQVGKAGRAYDFDGVTDILTVSANSVFNTDDFSIFFLLNPDELRIQGIIDKNDFVNSWRVFMNDTNGTLEFDARSDADNLEATLDISTDTWSSFVATYGKSTTTAKIYINGVEKGSNTSFTNAGNDNNSTPRVSPAATDKFNGQIQHVAWFNTALSANEALELSKIAGVA